MPMGMDMALLLISRAQAPTATPLTASMDALTLCHMLPQDLSMKETIHPLLLLLTILLTYSILLLEDTILKM